jgi:hypothetical protein
VALVVQGGELIILDPGDRSEICRHTIPADRGSKVVNTDHKRDKNPTLAEKAIQTAELFADPQKALEWLEKVAAEKPRYTRDKFGIIAKVVGKTGTAQAVRALDYCLERGIYSASDFSRILALQSVPEKKDPKIKPLNPLNGKTHDSAAEKPDTGNISDYQDIMDSKNS